jgi:sugar (pentulose or hexulose) kinase
MSVDTTACSVVLLDDDMSPVLPCILYCDARSAPQTEKIIEIARGDPFLRVCSDGNGPISAEWMIPKCLWVKENMKETWDRAVHVCEMNDYINFKLTGSLVASVYTSSGIIGTVYYSTDGITSRAVMSLLVGTGMPRKLSNLELKVPRRGDLYHYWPK